MKMISRSVRCKAEGFGGVWKKSEVHNNGVQGRRVASVQTGRYVSLRLALSLMWGLACVKSRDGSPGTIQQHEYTGLCGDSVVAPGRTVGII